MENNLNNKIEVIRVAVSLMTEEDLSGPERLQEYQARMKKLFKLEIFAFVDRNGLIYTSLGTRDNIGDYDFDYTALTQPEISVLNPESEDKKAVIAVPIEPLAFNGEELVVCFMEINMEEMLSGVSVEAQNTETTFCNIYTAEGYALSNTVLGGLAVEDNLLEALTHAEFDKGYSYEQVVEDFAKGIGREVSFTYNDIHETISYEPVKGTDWMLTYLMRESILSDRISSVSNGIIKRSIIQSMVTLAVLSALFGFVFSQAKKNAKLMLETETAQAEIRGKQEEIEQRIVLQERLEEQSHALSDALATAEEVNRAKTAFLSNMSHEIRTPMNAIIGLDNIALNDPDISDTTRDHLERIGSSAEHLLQLINDILDMSRIESGRMILKNEEFSFRELLKPINTMFSSQCNDKGLEYTCNIRGDMDDYYVGDNTKLRQVLINILGNAVKFTPEGGSVSLDVSRKAQMKGLTTLCFRIEDTGIGMSKEYLPHIFDTFSQEDYSSTNKYGSTGLGMAITKNIVEMMNGSIEVESEKGKGTVFTVTVTLMDSEHKDMDEGVNRVAKPLFANTVMEEFETAMKRKCIKTKKEENKADLTGRRILLAEDVQINAEIMMMVLQMRQMEGELAENGKIAVDMFSEHEPGYYDAILMDMRMPEMDGLTATQVIRAMDRPDAKSIPIIALTANAFDEDVQRSMQVGLNAHLSKSVQPEILYETLENLIRS